MKAMSFDRAIDLQPTLTVHYQCLTHVVRRGCFEAPRSSSPVTHSWHRTWGCKGSQLLHYRMTSTQSRLEGHSSLATLLLAELLNGDSVHVHDALLGEGLAHGHRGALLRVVLDLTDETESLKLVKSVADVLSSGKSGLLGLGAAASLSTEVLTEALDANLLPHVKLVADRGGTSVKPVVVEWSELAIAGSLNVLAPLLNIILIRTDFD